MNARQFLAKVETVRNDYRQTGDAKTLCLELDDIADQFNLSVALNGSLTPRILKLNPQELCS